MQKFSNLFLAHPLQKFSELLDHHMQFFFNTLKFSKVLPNPLQKFPNLFLAHPLQNFSKLLAHPMQKLFLKVVKKFLSPQRCMVHEFCLEIRNQYTK